MKTFKTLSILLLSVLALGFASCSNNDDEPNNPTTEQGSTLSGIWMEIQEDSYNIHGVKVSTWAVPAIEADYVAFKPDGTFLYGWVEYTSDTKEWESFTGTYVYSPQNSTVKMYIGGELMEIFTIKSLSKSELVWQYEDFDEDGYYVQTYKKIDKLPMDVKF